MIFVSLSAMEKEVFEFIKKGPFKMTAIAPALDTDIYNFWSRVNGKIVMNDDEVKRLEAYMKQWGFKKSRKR